MGSLLTILTSLSNAASPLTSKIKYKIMFQRIKPILFLVLTLLLGFLLGVMSSQYLVKQRIRNFQNQDRGKGFIRMHHNILDITPEQTQQVDPILIKYFEKLSSHRKSAGGIIDSMLGELEPLLSEEQRVRMEEIRMRTRRRGGQGRSSF